VYMERHPHELEPLLVPACPGVLRQSKRAAAAQQNLEIWDWPYLSARAGQLDITVPPGTAPGGEHGLKRVRTEVPSGLTASGAGGSRHRYWTHIAAVRRIPGRQPACLGPQLQRRIRHASAVYQQVALSVTASE
jgi:hypothetical protein